VKLYIVYQQYHDGGRCPDDMVLGLVVAPDEAAARAAVPKDEIREGVPFYPELHVKKLAEFDPSLPAYVKMPERFSKPPGF
jgi:hypothetical protein